MNFHLSDTLWDVFTFLFLLLPSSIYLCLTIPSSWWTSSILEVTQSCCSGNWKQMKSHEKQTWKAIKSTASSYHLSDPKVLFTVACLKQYLGCQNKSKIQDYRQAYYVGGVHINPPQIHGLRRKSKAETSKCLKRCLFQHLEQKLNTGISILLQWEETTMTDDTAVQ